jgi:hypothetical protein
MAQRIELLFYPGWLVASVYDDGGRLIARGVHKLG